MRLPRGFGKNYFTLRAITATSNQITLNKNQARTRAFYIDRSFEDELDFSEEKPDELEILDTFATHCNCYYHKKTKKALLLCPKQKLTLLYFYNIAPPSLALFN